MYLFDTDTLSNIVKRKPSEQLLLKLQDLPMGLQYTTSINIGEIYYGACRTQRRDQIIKAFEVHVFPNITILPFDKKSGKAFGRLKSALEKTGHRMQGTRPENCSHCHSTRSDINYGKHKTFCRHPGFEY